MSEKPNKFKHKTHFCYFALCTLAAEEMVLEGKDNSKSSKNKPESQMKITPQINAAFLTFVRERTTVIYQQHFLPCKSVPREQAVQSVKLLLQYPRGRHSKMIHLRQTSWSFSVQSTESKSRMAFRPFCRRKQLADNLSSGPPLLFHSGFCDWQEDDQGVNTREAEWWGMLPLWVWKNPELPLSSSQKNAHEDSPEEPEKVWPLLPWSPSHIHFYNHDQQSVLRDKSLFGNSVSMLTVV